MAAYVAGRVSVTEDAEDITALVFGRFVEKLADFDGRRGTVMTWVLTMAHHAVVDYYRAQRPVGLSATELAGVLAGNHGDQLRALVHEEDLGRIARFLLRQPVEIREMFALRFEQDLRIREIATLMGISTDAAKQRFARTLREIRLELTREPDLDRGGRTCALAD